MKGVLVHGSLLAVMLVYGYLTWTKEKPTKSVAGEVVMWSRGEPELKAVEFATTDHTLRLERRGEGAKAYWWGLDTRTTKKLKPKDPPPAPPPPVPGEPPPPPPPVEAPEYITESVTREFPVGEPGEKLVKDLARMRAIRSLGVVKDEAKKDYELVDTTKTIAVVFTDGAKTLVLGGKVQGGSDRYVLDVDTGKGFVLTGTLITPLEGGEGSLRPSDLRSFDPKTAMQVEIGSGDKKKLVHRIKVKQSAGDPADPHAPPPKKEQEIETWGEGATADTAAANFIDKVEKLKPVSYAATIDVKTLTAIVTLTYRDLKGKPLGTMQLLKLEKPGEALPPPPPPTDPAAPPPPPPAPPPPVVEYYLMTERTRVPALLPKVEAERIVPDLATVFPAP